MKWSQLSPKQISLSSASDTSPLQWALSGQYANLDATSQVLGAGSFVPGDGVEGAVAAGVVTILSEETEHEWAMTIDSAQVANDDTIDIQVAFNDSSPLDAYTNEATITVVEAAAASRRVFVIS